MSLTHNQYVEGLIQEVTEAGKALPADVFQDDNARQRLRAAASQLSAALDTPIGGVRRIIFDVSRYYAPTMYVAQTNVEGQAVHLPITRIAIEGGWFIALADGNTPKTAADLAKRTGAEELLIGTVRNICRSSMTDAVFNSPSHESPDMRRLRR